MKSDIEIARETDLRKIKEVATTLGIPREEVQNYGRYIAKVPIHLIDKKQMDQHNLILVTAITPTKAGIGKTTVSIGLALGLNKIGKKAVVALREPSLGPCFGMKGGAAGGGYAQVLPMENINLHFTGDFHAVTSAHNMITALLDKIDVLIVGGGMAYTFTNALGYSIGNSLCEPDKLELAKDIMAKAKEKGVNFLIPVDNVIANKFAEDAQWQIVDSDQIPEGWMGLDIGPKSAEIFAHAIEHAGTVFWNGPLGVSEWKNFAEGTFKVAQALAHSDAYSIIGGGDSAAAVEKLGFAKQMSHISTGGGASLELIEGLELPGIACLMEKE